MSSILGARDAPVVLPIPDWMAFRWFLGILVEASVAGTIAGAVVEAPAGA